MDTPKQNIFQKDLFLYKPRVNAVVNIIETILVFLIIYNAFTNNVKVEGFAMLSGIVLPAFMAMYFISTSFSYTSRSGIKTGTSTFTVFFNTMKNKDNMFLWRFFSYILAPFGMLFLYPIMRTDYFNLLSLVIFFGLLIVPINSFFLFVHNPKTSQKMLLTYISLCGAAFLFGGELSRLANISAHFIYGLPMFFTWVVSVINSTAQPTTKTPGVHFTNQDII